MSDLYSETADSLIEIYTDERIAEFLLNNAIDYEDYLSAREEVKALGLDPDAIKALTPVPSPNSGRGVTKP